MTDRTVLDSSVPELAQAAGRAPSLRSKPRVAVVLAGAGAAALILLGACRASRLPYPDSIQSVDPGERMLGVREAGERRDRGVVAMLVKRLEDEDEGVRFFTILALERITGTRLGYDYADPPAQRARAVQRWRSNIQQTATRHDGSGGSATAPAGDEGRPPEVAAGS